MEASEISLTDYIKAYFAELQLSRVASPSP